MAKWFNLHTKGVTSLPSAVGATKLFAWLDAPIFNGVCYNEGTRWRLAVLFLHCATEASYNLNTLQNKGGFCSFFNAF